MTQKRMGRPGWHRATPKTSNHSYFTAIKSSLQTVIVTLAVWGWLPMRLASWMLHRGGLRDD